MNIYFGMKEHEKFTPIKVADALIENDALLPFDLEEIAEHLLAYCKHEKVKYDR